LRKPIPDCPQIDQHAGAGQHIVILAAGIGGLCAAYLLRSTKFKVTILEPNPYVGVPLSDLK
jgi:monoamine oxidase